MHDEFEQIVLDALGSFRAVTSLSALLRADGGGDLTVGSCEGIAVLLEGVQQRLELVVDGLGATALALGMPDFRVMASGDVE